MKKILIILITISNILSAQEPIHSSASFYYENKTFSNSVQKTDGVLYGVGADIHHNNSEYKFAYEKGLTNTKQPPLPKDLKTDKLFLRYSYDFNKKIGININYINVLHDNLAITDGGETYGLGLKYNFTKKIVTNFTQYHTQYQDFEVYQSDLRLDYKTKIFAAKTKLSSITKYINIDETNVNSFTKNTQDDYLTSGFKLHSNYNSYHFGAGAYFGKRAFAIMSDGFKSQHHAMEFDRTYALMLGKNINTYVFRLQYVYQKATELPSLNSDVNVKNIRFITNIRF